MITVTLITNDGSGLPKRVSLEEGTQLGTFLEDNVHTDLDNFVIRVRANGMSIDVFHDYILQDGDRVSLAPKKVDGAA